MGAQGAGGRKAQCAETGKREVWKDGGRRKHEERTEDGVKRKEMK